MNIIEFQKLMKNNLRGSILHRTFRLNMFASQVMGKDIVNMFAQPEDLFDAVEDNDETDRALLEMLWN